MKKWVALLLFISHGVWAEPLSVPQAGLDEVVFQRTQTQWVSTNTALVQVSINATLTNTDLVKARSSIQSTLEKIAPGEWHLTGFNRTQDNSGLERLEAMAEARVTETHLNAIYEKAKTLSRPGMTYAIKQVEFKPSTEEEQTTKEQLRHRLYQQIIQEISALNKLYPEQHYTLHRLFFWEGDGLPLPPTPRGGYQTQALMAVANSSNNNSAAIALSRELIMTVLVELASARKE